MQSWRRSAMCAGGPPKPTQPIRPHSRATVSSPGRSAGAAISSGCVTENGCRSRSCGLEQLDRVSRGVVDQHLLASGSADDVVPELETGGAQPFDLGMDVLDDEMDPVPTTGF